MDVSVCEASGLVELPLVLPTVHKSLSQSSKSFPSPSTNWSDAMLAAERFGLLDGVRVLTCDRGSWQVWKIDQFGQVEGPVLASAATGPLAICRAILKLHHA